MFLNSEPRSTMSLNRQKDYHPNFDSQLNQYCIKFALDRQMKWILYIHTHKVTVVRGCRKKN